MAKEISMQEIDGIKIGHAQDTKGGTGCTVILCEKGAIAGVDVRGGGPATRETDLLNPVNMMERIHGVMLSGGSAFRLDAASGAMAFLEERGIGFDVGIGRVPIVCGASLFDLNVGDQSCRPNGRMGYEACQNAQRGPSTCLKQRSRTHDIRISETDQESVGELTENVPLAEGNVGAGTGATVGKLLGPTRMMKSGLGIYGMQIGDLKVTAVVCVNALGDIFDFDTGRQLAGLLSEDQSHLISTEEAMYESYEHNRSLFGGNTTIGCVITNAKLTKSQANKLASMAHDGLARVIRPVHTSADGDTIFLLATEEIEAHPDAVGTLAARVTAKAVNRAVEKSAPAYGLKAASMFK